MCPVTILCFTSLCAQTAFFPDITETGDKVRWAPHALQLQKGTQSMGQSYRLCKVNIRSPTQNVMDFRSVPSVPRYLHLESFLPYQEILLLIILASWRSTLERMHSKGRTLLKDYIHRWPNAEWGQPPQDWGPWAAHAKTGTLMSKEQQ